MTQMRGRRIGARTRYRVGDLMADDGTLAASDPTDPGTTDTTTDSGTTTVTVDASLTL